MTVVERQLEIFAAELSGHATVDFVDRQVADERSKQPRGGVGAGGGVAFPVLVALLAGGEFGPIGEEVKIRQRGLGHQRLHLAGDGGEGLAQLVAQAGVAAQERTRSETPSTVCGLPARPSSGRLRR